VAFELQLLWRIGSCPFKTHQPDALFACRNSLDTIVARPGCQDRLGHALLEADMRVSTHAGDRGKTGLFSGERVSKAAERVHACGEVDELNAVVGALAAVLQGSVAIPQELTAELGAIQSELFRMGAWLSTTPGSPVSEELPRLDPDAVTRIESAAERLESELAPLKGFILPGGDLTACWAHLARTVCRRAERRVVAVLESTIAAKPARGTDLAQGSAGEAGEEQDAMTWCRKAM